MKHPKFKLFIIPLILFIVMLSLCMYITIELAIHDEIEDTGALFMLLIANFIFSVIPSVIYYAFYIAYKKISKMTDKDEKILDKDKIEAAKLDILLRAHNKVMGNIDNK